MGMVTLHLVMPPLCPGLGSGLSCSGILITLTLFQEVSLLFIQEHGCCLGYLWVLGLADVPFSIGTQVPRYKRG